MRKRLQSSDEINIEFEGKTHTARYSVASRDGKSKLSI